MQGRFASPQGRAMAAAHLVAEGLALHQQGRIDAAAERYRAALGVDAGEFDAGHLLGVALTQQGRIDEALVRLQEAARVRRDSPAVWTNLGNALQASSRWAEALEAYRQAVELDARFTNALMNAGVVQSQVGRHDLALEVLTQAHHLEPGRADVLFNLGIALDGLARWDESEGVYGRVLELQPQHRDAWLNRANGHVERGQYAVAIAQYEAFLATAPGDVRVLTWLGNLYSIVGRGEAARHAFQRAIDLAPNDPRPRFDLGMNRLAYGELIQGFELFEARWHIQELDADVRMATQRPWRGESIEVGQTILLSAEQGFGDTLHFCRYAPLLARRGARVILKVPPALVRLLKSLGPAVEVVSEWPEIAPDALHCPLMSLPHAFGTTLDSVPRAPRYLFADAADVERWGQRFTPSRDLRVGIVWAGAARTDQPVARAIDRRRSLALSEFAPLSAIAGIRFYSLQMGPPREELRQMRELRWRGEPIVDWMSDVRDFSDSAAIVAHMDLVITCDTSMVHLAGSCGTPVWMLSRFDGCWRWLRERSDSPWYPGLRIYRQAEPLDWRELMTRVRADLALHVAETQPA